MNAYTEQNLEKLFSPSHWCQRMGPEAVIDYHVKFVTEASMLTKQSVPSQVGVSYGDTEGQKLDLFGFNALDGKDTCIFVFIHGGYWQEMSRSVSSYCVQPLVAAGHAVVIVGYDLAPEVTLLQMIEQIKKAIEYVITIAEKENVKSIYVGGHSAGAHLTATLLTSQLPREKRTLIKGCILISGVFDLRRLILTSVNTVLKLTDSEAEQCSPFLLVSSIPKDLVEQCAIHILVGQYESPEFIQQSLEYGEELRRAGMQVEHEIVPRVDHFDIVEGLNNQQFHVTQIILDILGRKMK